MKARIRIKPPNKCFGEAWHLLIWGARNPLLSASTTSPVYGRENPEPPTFKFFPSANPPLWNIPPGAHLFSFSHKQNPSPLPHAEHAAASVGSAERSVYPGVSWLSRLSPPPLGFSLFVIRFLRSFFFISHLRRRLPAARQPSLLLTFLLLRPVVGENPAAATQI